MYVKYRAVSDSDFLCFFSSMSFFPIAQNHVSQFAGRRELNSLSYSGVRSFPSLPQPSWVLLPHFRVSPFPTTCVGQAALHGAQRRAAAHESCQDPCPAIRASKQDLDVLGADACSPRSFQAWKTSIHYAHSMYEGTTEVAGDRGAGWHASTRWEQLQVNKRIKHTCNDGAACLTGTC